MTLQHLDGACVKKTTYLTFISFCFLQSRHEHKDILGALDYLASQYPSVAQDTARVGLYGCSMGGATMLVSLSFDKRFRAAFVDSMACNVYKVIQHNMNILTPGFGSAVVSMACTMAPFRSFATGCPPFPIDPIDRASTLSRDKAVYFYHAKNDVLCPLKNIEECVSAAKGLGAVVQEFYNTTYAPPYQLGKCDGHCDMAIVHLEDFEAKISAFFNKELKVTQK